MKSRLLEVSSMTMNAYPFRQPGAIVRDLKGAFAFDNDSAWWKGAYVAMPQSKATGDGVYEFTSGDLTMSVHSDPASFVDMRWIYPRLPSDGRGAVDLELKWRGSVEDYVVRNADVTVGRAHGSGTIGVTMADTVSIHDANIRFSGVDTRLLEQMIPHFSSPRRGVLSGRVRADGGQHSLVLNTDVTFDDQRAGRSQRGQPAAQALAGWPDDLKLRSSATLFACVSPAGSVFERVLDRYFRGERERPQPEPPRRRF
jgi:hypothetical protein